MRIERIDLKIGILKSGLTRSQIAEEMGRHPGLISRILNGTHNPTKAEREDIAAILEVSVCDIFHEEALSFSEQYLPSPEVA